MTPNAPHIDHEGEPQGAPTTLEELVTGIRKITGFQSLHIARNSIVEHVPGILDTEAREGPDALQMYLFDVELPLVIQAARSLSLPYCKEMLTNANSSVAALGELGVMPTFELRANEEGSMKLYPAANRSFKPAPTFDETIQLVYVSLKQFLEVFFKQLHRRATTSGEEEYRLLSEVVAHLSHRHYFQWHKSMGIEYITLGLNTARKIIASLVHVVPELYKLYRGEAPSPEQFAATLRSRSLMKLLMYISEMHQGGFIGLLGHIRDSNNKPSSINSDTFDFYTPDAFTLTDAGEIEFKTELIQQVHAEFKACTEMYVSEKTETTFCPARYMPKEMSEFLSWVIEVYIRYSSTNVSS